MRNYGRSSLDSQALLAAIQIHIKQLRNRRDVEVHWPAFQVLVAENTASVLALSSRWLISVCDTFADYGTPVERRNALLLSMFVNMIRVADTYRYLLDPAVNRARQTELSTGQVSLYDGLVTLHLDRQDTCLNLSKRLVRVLEETPFFLSAYHILVKRMMQADSLLLRFASLSENPERVFPIAPLLMPDNYGVF